MNSFQEMGLHPLLLKWLDQSSFTQPTPIQAQAIPLALEGKDILGSAQTGTGKTLAFVIPAITRIILAPTESVLILTPTRELAQQVINNIKQLLGRDNTIKTALLIGGEALGKQFQQLKANPRLLVGTPGRIIDHLERGTLQHNTVHFLVLDETDRMLDMGFGIQLEEIMRYLPKKRQTLMFSATIPSKIEKLAEKYLHNPERISAGEQSTPATNIKQEIIRVTESEKYSSLLLQLNQREGSIIVFVKTKMGAQGLAYKLVKENHNASAIHGDLRQQKRERVMNDFRRGRCRIMVATDIAARGLDIPHIQHVINYDLPQSPEDYIHRIGRTARAGAKGFSLALITPQDNRKWREIHNILNPTDPLPRDAYPVSSERRRFSSGSNRNFSGNRFRSSNNNSENRSDRSENRRSEGGNGFGFRKRDFSKSDRFQDRPARSERSFSDRNADRPARPARDFSKSDRNQDRPSRNDRQNDYN